MDERSGGSAKRACISVDSKDKAHTEEFSDEDLVMDSFLAGLEDDMSGVYLSENGILEKFTRKSQGEIYINKCKAKGPPFRRWDRPLKQTIYLWPNILAQRDE